MTTRGLRVFIQARMSSSRFPGKVLAPFRGRPMIGHVIARVAAAVDRGAIVVATTAESSDDPLAAYVGGLGVSVFRGSRDDVVSRLQACLAAHPCRWFLRVCADSPLLDSALIRQVVAHADRSDLDLITNVFPRTFPKGESLELILASTFAGLDAASLTPAAREHVTTVFYEQPDRFRILNVASPDPSRAALNFCVDTVEDLRRLECLEDVPA